MKKIIIAVSAILGLFILWAFFVEAATGPWNTRSQKDLFNVYYGTRQFISCYDLANCEDIVEAFNHARELRMDRQPLMEPYPSQDPSKCLDNEPCNAELEKELK